MTYLGGNLINKSIVNQNLTLAVCRWVCRKRDLNLSNISRTSSAQIGKNEAREYRCLSMEDAMLDVSLFHALRYQTSFFLS